MVVVSHPSNLPTSHSVWTHSGLTLHPEHQHISHKLDSSRDSSERLDSFTDCDRLPIPPEDFIMVAHRRGPWSQHEDQWLVNLVARNGPHNWVRISQEIGSRSPKQCRERYHQNLKPSLNHDPITGEEGELIEKMVAEMGKRWAEIARRLKGRSDNAVKNWWNGGQNATLSALIRDPESTCTTRRLVTTTQLPMASPTTKSTAWPHTTNHTDHHSTPQ
jgi:Myb-like DNA-binding protein FlbD